MRASDSDREKIAARLRDAHADGRISGEEFHDRLDALYAARTYGEIEPLVRDLPARTYKTPDLVQAKAPTASSPARRSGFDKAMTVMWSVWAAAVAINLVIWVLVSIQDGVQYFWPMWVAGPAGAALLSVELIRRAVGSDQ